MKTEVYSWRVSSELKAELEREARSRKTSLSAVLSLAVLEWLQKSAKDVDEDENQRRLHESALNCVGTFAGRNPRRAESGRQAIRDRLRRQNAR